MKKNKKRTENDELRIISSSFQKLLQLDEQERKIHRAQRKEIGTIKNVMDRLCDDKDIKERMAKDEELSMLLQNAIDLISSIRTLIRQWIFYSLRRYSCGELFIIKKNPTKREIFLIQTYIVIIGDWNCFATSIT